MAEWPRSGPYLRALAEWGFDSRLATRFAILGRNLFASPGARGSFSYYCGVVIIFLSLFSRNWELDVSSETLWRSCGVGRGAGSVTFPWDSPLRVLCRGEELRAFCVFDLIYTNLNRRRRRFTDQLSRFIVDTISASAKSMKRRDIEKEVLAAKNHR
jgi:hypothetical protein